MILFPIKSCWLILLYIILTYPINLKGCESFYPLSSIDSYTPIEKNGISITSFSFESNESIAWDWLKNKFDATKIECVLRMYGLLHYKKLPTLNSDCIAELHFKQGGNKNVSTNIRCYLQPSWKLTNGKYASDGKTVNIIVGCGVFEYSTCIAIMNHKLDFQLKVANESYVQSKISSYRNSSLKSFNEMNIKSVVLNFTTNPILERFNKTIGCQNDMKYKYKFNSSLSHNNLPAFLNSYSINRFSSIDHKIVFNNFTVCTIQTNRNPLSPYQMYMFVAHYLYLGFHVIVYDRMGFHKAYIQFFLGDPLFDYHPYTLLEKVWPSFISLQNASIFDFSFKIYYDKEKSSTGKSKSKVASDTQIQDRDKTMTYDHARLEYSIFKNIRGMLFIDIDEYLFCPSENFTISSQRKYIRKILNRVYSKGYEEVRIDVHPYVSKYNSIDRLKACFQESYDIFEHKNTKIDTTGLLKTIQSMHNCFKGNSTYQMWPKSIDIKQKCPFHYNHWSCDGGKSGGRQLGCYCKVSFEWYKKAKKKFTERCHLAHYNHHMYKFQSHRHRTEKKHTASKAIIKNKYQSFPSETNPFYHVYDPRNFIINQSHII